MKVILTQHLSGAKSYEAGSEIEVSDSEAASMIKKGMAELKTPEETAKFFKKLETVEKKRAEAEAEAKAILEKDRLENELVGLYHDVVLKEAEINGAILEPEEILAMVENLKKGRENASKNGGGSGK